MNQVLKMPFSKIIPYQGLNFYQYKKPLYHDQYSGLTATIFGATGLLGKYVVSTIGKMGSDLIIPHDSFTIYTDNIRSLKTCAPIKRMKFFPGMNYQDLDLIKRHIKKSDIVINLLGPRNNTKLYKDFQDVNILYAKKIAKACSQSPNVKKLIHFSASSANQNSISYDLKTKYYGEQQVLSIYPKATILKPTMIYGYGDKYLHRLFKHGFYSGNRNIVYSNLMSTIQPIQVRDVAEAIKNIIYMDQTAGNIYYLGGPFKYTRKQALQMIQTYYKIQQNFFYFPANLAIKISQAKLFYNSQYFNREIVTKESIDMLVPQGVNTINDLNVRAVSFKQGLKALDPTFFQTQSNTIQDQIR